MAELHPLRFKPIFRRYLWGGTRLGADLNKPIGEGNDYAESWEIADHGDDQSRVAVGPLAGATLRQLVETRGRELLGRHHPQRQFPLLFKFLDAQRPLSLQVHPNDEQAARLSPPSLGKTEAWIVLDAAPDSVLYAGLKRGFDRPALEREVNRGTIELCLHKLHPQPGDCVLIPAGVVHSIGEGLLVAEIQQTSDTTYRLHDWNRLGPDGRLRELHVEEALAAIDFAHGPVEPRRPEPTDRPWVSRLAACENFVVDRWTFDEPREAGGDDRFHIVAVLDGEIEVEGDPARQQLGRGGTILLPASSDATMLAPIRPTVLLDMYLP